MFGEVDLAHAPHAELADDGVPGEDLARPQRHARHTICAPGRVNLLRDWESREVPVLLDANYDSNGTLTIYGQNLGRTVGRDGEYEYEYWYGIKAEHVPALLIALGGNRIFNYF